MKQLSAAAVERAMKLQVSFANCSWQIERTKLRGTLAGCRVIVHEHLDDTLSITFGPHVVGRYQTEAGEMTPPRKATKAVASRNGLEKSGQKQPDFPTFPQPLRLDRYLNWLNQNRTFHLLIKPDMLIC
jgi:hypothetical protein